MGCEFVVASMEENAGQVAPALTGLFQGRHSWKKDFSELEELLAQIRREFPMESEIEFRVIVEGAPQPLRPAIRDEAYLIVHEALSNAFQHSHAADIEVELEYAASHLRLLVRDNGVGIDPKVFSSKRDGHWGLSWMKERSDRIGGRLRVLSRAAAGTEIELFVPGQIAFALPLQNRPIRWLSRLYS
jgi:signal transduction histidine kinase